MIIKSIRGYRNSFRGLSRDIWLLALITLINRSGTMVVPFLTVYMTSSLGFSLKEAGWVMAAFGCGSVLGTFIGGKLTDKGGYFPVMVWSLFLGGLMFLGMMFMKTLEHILVYTFFLSSVAEMFRPANLVSISAYSTPENRTRSMALVRLAINLGFTAGPAIGGFLAYHVGYRGLFIADGLTCISASLLLIWFLKPGKRGESARHERLPKEGLPPWKNLRFLRFMAFVIMNAMVFMQMFGTLPVFFKNDMKLNEDQIGLLMALNGLMVATLEMPLIYVTEKKYNKMRLMTLGALLTALSYLGFVLMGDMLLVAVLCILFLTFGEMFSFPFSNTWAMENSSSGRQGEYMGWYSMGFSVSFILAPLIGLSIAEAFGFHALWLIMTGIGLMAMAGLGAMGRKEKEQGQEGGKV
jgi:predicted MFS family arabinose efflux permease